jgi:hypothetical protein
VNTIHAEHIESLWNSLHHFMRRKPCRLMFPSYLNEFMWRRYIAEQHIDPFVVF